MRPPRAARPSSPGGPSPPGEDTPQRGTGLPVGERPSRGDSRRRLGQAGEAAAVDALRARGYRIIERNVRLRRGELDVVAEDAGDLVFVEVKARRSRVFGSPAEGVGPRKQRALTRLAAGYLARRRLGERACRFDVVEVWVDASGGRRVEIIKDAFHP